MNKKELIIQLNNIKEAADKCLSELDSLSIGIEISLKERKGGEKRFSSLRHVNINYTSNPRHFIRNYVTGKKMSGPKKFTLLLAYLAKGKVDVEIDIKKIISNWNKLKSKDLLGYDFNIYYAVQSKTKGWIDSKRHGLYTLTDKWQEIFI